MPSDVTSSTSVPDSRGGEVSRDAGRVSELQSVRISWRRVAQRYSGVLVAVGFFLTVVLVMPYGAVFEFDPDEGNNVIKALLLERGYHFLDDIWSDQPPLFSEVLRWAFKLFGWDPAVGRTVVLGFSALIVFGLYDSLRRAAGHIPAAVGLLLLLLTSEYLTLSVSIMIGLPAIAWALMSVWALGRWSERSGRTWLVLSAVFMSLSFATKMFTAFLLPIFGGYVLLRILAQTPGPRRVRLKQAMLDAGIWGGVFAVATGLLLWSVLTADDPAAIYRAHQIARDARSAVDNLTGEEMVPRFLSEDAFLFAVTWIGVVQAFLHRVPTMMLCAVWLVAALVSVYFHQPVWVHHRLLLTIPAAILAGFGLTAVFGVSEPRQVDLHGLRPDGRLRLRRIARLSVPALLLGTILLVYPERVRALVSPPHWSSDERDSALQGKINAYSADAKLMVTSRQMYAFRAGIPVPPDLAVTSIKRFYSGLLHSTDIIRSIERQKPEIVVLTTRWSGTVRGKVRRALEQQAYIRTFRDPKNMRAELWIRGDLGTEQERARAERRRARTSDSELRDSPGAELDDLDDENRKESEPESPAESDSEEPDQFDGDGDDESDLDVEEPALGSKPRKRARPGGKPR